jgi:Predicted Zn-dependent proteases
MLSLRTLFLLWLLLTPSLLSNIEAPHTFEPHLKRSQIGRYGQKTLHIRAYGKVDAAYLLFADSVVQTYFGYETRHTDAIAVRKSFLTNYTNRYNAAAILNFYQTPSPQLLITEQDIAKQQQVSQQDEGLVLGLAHQPGNICIVSTFRLKEAGIAPILFWQRLQKVIIHEIGHNLGLPHCTDDKTCVMIDAKGNAFKTDKTQLGFCKYCRIRLGDVK